jgi:hypothetical protein
VQGAIDWLEKNQDKSVDEIKAEDASSSLANVGPTEGVEEAKSLVCNDCGKLFKNAVAAEFHASKTYANNSGHDL